MDQITVINETKTKVDENLIQNLVKKVLKAEGKSQVELNIIIVDNKTIQKINQEYRNINKPTDVISFAFCDTPSIIEYEYELLGDIYISYEQAIAQSLEYGHSLTRELAFLVVHGMYHLLGYDHQTPEQTTLMRNKEEMILNETEETKRKQEV